MRRIQIYDTTLRDGAQGEGVSFSLPDKLALTRALDGIGVDYVEGGYPGSNEKDFQYFQQVASLGLKRSIVCAFGMTRRKGISAERDRGLKALLQSGAATITLVGKASAFQAAEVLRTKLDENLAMIRDSVSYLVEAGRRVIFDAEHYYDGWKENRDYALRAVQAAVEAGATSVTLCDTNGGSLPEEIAEITAATVTTVGVPVGIHCHNDCELAVANSLAAVAAGATIVQGTINGFGERCGNADLISVIANLATKKQGYELLQPDGIAHLTELSRYVYELMNVNFRANQPFVGKSAFAHKGGMHVSGVARNTASYEHIDPQLVGNERRILVSELSGRSNIVAASASLRGNVVSGADGVIVKPNADQTEEILAKVVSMENAGYQFEAAEASFALLVQKCLGTFQRHFERLHYHVNVETGQDGQIRTEATVKIRIGETIRHEVAEGDGPVNALDAAMRKALNGSFPGLAKLHLVDYKVRVINSEAATAACVRVIIESQDENDVWGTVGVSENVIEASWIALVDSFEYKLWKDQH
jgi:2-isopropylmalate synthase